MKLFLFFFFFFVVYFNPEDDKKTARQQADEQSKTMQLNVVRLCFQVFLRNADGSFSTMLTPVVSQPIYDSSMFLVLFLKSYGPV